MDYKFEEQWPHMRTIVLKLLHQESVSHVEWQDLFYSVHMVCLWDDKGSSKIKETLKESISDYIFRAQKVKFIVTLYSFILLYQYNRKVLGKSIYFGMYQS